MGGHALSVKTTRVSKEIYEKIKNIIFSRLDCSYGEIKEDPEKLDLEI